MVRQSATGDIGADRDFAAVADVGDQLIAQINFAAFVRIAAMAMRLV